MNSGYRFPLLGNKIWRWSDCCVWFESSGLRSSAGVTLLWLLTATHHPAAASICTTRLKNNRQFSPSNLRWTSVPSVGNLAKKSCRLFLRQNWNLYGLFKADLTTHVLKQSLNYGRIWISSFCSWSFSSNVFWPIRTNGRFWQSA